MFFFFFQAEDGIRDLTVTGVQTCALPISMPFLIEQGQRNLTKPVKLYAQLAIDSARSIDSLFKDSMMTALAKDLSPPEMKDLVTARDAATNAIHSYADWLEKRARSMRSEEHTSELQSQSNLVCRLLLE